MIKDMVLYIDTTESEHIVLEITKANKILVKKRIKVWRNQAEKLLPSLDKILQAKKTKLKDIKKIIVVNEGGTFTSLRSGIIIANALAFALQIPVQGTHGKALKIDGLQVVKPLYNAKPNIG